MINKHSKGKEHTRRPLPVRAIAILMAIAMVLSVLYINNRRSVVNADPAKTYDETTETSLGQYLTSGMFYSGNPAALTAGDYNVYVPIGNAYNQYTFALPAISSVSTSAKTTFYQYTEAGTVKYGTSVPDGLSAVDTFDIWENETVNYSWVDASNSPVTSVTSTASAGTSAVSLKSKNSYTYTVKKDDAAVDGMSDITIADYTKKSDDATFTDSGVRLNIVSRNVADINISNSGTDISITDQDATADGTTSFYFGDVQYSYSINETSSDYASIDSFKTSLLGQNDGTYTINKRIVKGDVVLSNDKTDSFTKNVNFVNSWSALQGSNSYDGSTSEGTKVLSVTGADPMTELSVSIETDSASPIINVTPSTSNPSDAPVVTSTSGGTAPATNLVTLKSDSTNTPDKLAGKTYKYTISLAESTATGALSDSISLSVTYADSNPVITSQTVETSGFSDNTCLFFKTPSVTLKANGTVDAGNISEFTLNKYSVTSSNTKGTLSSTDSISPTAVDLTSDEITTDITLDAGYNFYSFGLVSSFGQTGKYTPSTGNDYLTLYYDNVAPVITGISLRQKIGDTVDFYKQEKTYTTSPESETFTQKVSCKTTSSIVINLTDNGGSATKEVICTDDNTPLSGTDSTGYTYVIQPSDDNNGNTVTYHFTIRDNVLNERTVAVTVSFFDDNISIDRRISEKTDKEKLYEIPSTGFLKWHDADVTKAAADRKFVIEYTIKAATEVPVNSIQYSIGGTTTTLSASDYTSTPETDADGIATGKTIYTVTKEFNGVSQSYSDIKIKFTNQNNVSKESDTLSVLYIDSDAPSVTPLAVKVGGSSGENVDQTKWYQKDLVIYYEFSDTVDSTKPHSEIKEITDVEGTVGDVPTVSNNSFVVTAKESTGPDDANRTNIKFTLVDNAGNKANYSDFFKVDWTVPKTNLEITGLTVTDGTQDDTVYSITTTPSISFSPYDYPSGVESIDATISDGTTPKTLNQASTPLTDYYSSFSDDTVFTVTVKVKDKAGYENTTSKKFKVDGTKPVVSVVVDDPAAPTKGINPYYNTDVKVKLTIKDTNIDESTVQIYDNEDPITVSWDKTNPSEWIGYYTATTPGSHTIKLTAKDDSQNAPDPEFATNTFVVDKAAPVIKTFLDDEEYNGTDAYKLSSVTSKMNVTDDYSRDEADEKVTVKLVTPTGETKTEVKNGDGPFTFTEDGVYTLTYEATDKAGNPASKVISFTVDGAKPVHNIYVSTGAAKSSKYSNEYSNKVGKFENEEYTYGKYFNTDVFLDVAYFDYNMASVTVYDNDVPVDVTWSKDGAYGRGTIAISSEGYHEIKMSSEDLSGNKVTDSGFSAVYFTIDKTAPVLTTYLDGEAYADTTAHREKAIAQVGVADDNPDEDDISITVERQPNSGASETTIYYGLNGLEYTLDGYYTVTYNVSDKAGNPANISCGFTIDNTAPVHNMYVLTDNPAKFSSYKNNYNNPVGVFASRPSQESYEYGQYYGSDVSVELNVYDYNLDWVYVTDNGAEISPSWTWDGPYGKAVVTLSSEGYHELKMWSKDLSGNETEDTEVGQKVRLYVDKTSPSITTYVNSSLYTEGSGVRYLNTNASVSVSVNDANKDSTDLVRTSKMTPPGGSSSSQTDNIGETTENYSTEADYEVTYVATDLAGNKSATRNVQFRVDKTPPQLSITGDGTSTAKSVAVSFGIKEAFYWDMTSAKYSIYKKAEGTAEALEKTVDFTPRSANDSQSYTLTDDAEYRFEFSAEDKCGNKTEMKGTLIKDGTAPVIMLSGVSNYDKTDKNVTLNVSVDEAFYSSNKVTLTGTRTDINGKKTNIDFNQFVTNRSKISNLEQLFEEDGIYDITVTSTDKAGNTSSKSLHFTIDTTDPEIGDLSKYDGVKTNKFEWDIDLDDLVKDLTVCDITVYMDGSLYDGTSEIADGSHVLRVEAVDELGHKSFKEVTFVLDTKGPNIIISNVEDGDRLLESTDVTVTVEIDEDILDTVSLNDKAVTVTDNKATFTVNAKGKYRINATAHDEAGNMSSTEIEFSFGKQMNIKLIAIIAGAAILLLILLLVLIKRRRDNAY